MPILTVLTNETARQVPFAPGPSVRELLEAAGMWVRSGCRANGACGLCLIEIKAGNVPTPNRNERLHLSEEQLARNTRLACQLTPEADLSIRVVNNGARSDWRELDEALLVCTPPRLPPCTATSAGPGYGLAVDLGTTHISVSLWDLHRAERLSGRVGPNPQSHYGSDVVTRLIAAGESEENAARIARIALDAVREALVEMCWRTGVGPAAVGRVAVVGNTSMLMLLSGMDSRLLLQPGSWTCPLDCRQDNGGWIARLGIHPQASIEVGPPCGGFVGSDLLAGVLATRLTDRPGGLLVDFGTNTEMALWDGDRLWATAAAGGPAFDSYQVRCGMPAEPGAIYRFERSDGGELRYAVIGGGEARGICGSGLVDLIACLRGAGELTAKGRFAAGAEESFLVRGTSPPLRLSLSDVDMFQRAKGAIGAGIKTLLVAARLKAADLRRICVGGAFGRHLDCRHAQAVGLLPGDSPAQVELCGNTALAGCERLLFSSTGAEDLAALGSRATVINLAQSADFERLFLESLYLEPMKVDEP